MIWWLILFVALMLGVREFFCHYRIERVEEEADVIEDAVIVEADTLLELVEQLKELPIDTDITKIFIVPKETEE